MQGTQYAPRESILCMEHFVALHSTHNEICDLIKCIRAITGHKWMPM